jgi:hypothetical protein
MSNGRTTFSALSMLRWRIRRTRSWKRMQEARSGAPELLEEGDDVLKVVYWVGHRVVYGPCPIGSLVGSSAAISSLRVQRAK